MKNNKETLQNLLEKVKQTSNNIIVDSINSLSKKLAKEKGENNDRCQ